jgi:hypothetical protein
MLLIRRVFLCAPLLALVAIVIGLPTVAFGSDDNRDFSARFLGVNETPSISTDATAMLNLHINGSGTTASIDYTLTFSGLRAPVTQAHVHFGQSKMMGGVVFYLCNATSATVPAGTPTCPQSGTVTGTITAAQIVAGAGATGTNQGIEAGQIDRVLKAIREGAAYGNVHSTMFPKGETRGQLRPSDS